jgi:hypothetical protein
METEEEVAETVKADEEVKSEKVVETSAVIVENGTVHDGYVYYKERSNRPSPVRERKELSPVQVSNLRH